jgi:hypothetical protein
MFCPCGTQAHVYWPCGTRAHVGFGLECRRHIASSCLAPRSGPCPAFRALPCIPALASHSGPLPCVPAPAPRSGPRRAPSGRTPPDLSPAGATRTLLPARDAPTRRHADTPTRRRVDTPARRIRVGSQTKEGRAPPRIAQQRPMIAPGMRLMSVPLLCEVRATPSLPTTSRHATITARSPAPARDSTCCGHNRKRAGRDSRSTRGP